MSMYVFFQHAHLEMIKTVANLTNNKDVFLCIILFHTRAGYLQTYETLLKEINAHPASNEVPPAQYAVKSVALADRNLNVPCESGIRYPTLVAMLNRQDMCCRILVIVFHNILVHACLY
jgi:hypothetical protein